MLTARIPPPDNHHNPIVGPGIGIHPTKTEGAAGTPGDHGPDESGCALMAKRTNVQRTTGESEAGPADPFSLQTIYCGDNLEKLSRMPSKCVDLIYIDPPFNSNRNYEVFWGEAKESRSFEDRHESTTAYIDFMHSRCVELRRVLKDTGSFYYHCDWHASHYVKVMLDQILGENSFQNEIIWKRTSAHSDGKQGSQHYGRIHDTIFLYTKSPTDYIWNTTYLDHDASYIDSHYRQVDEHGRRFQWDNLTGPGGAAKGNPFYEVLGVKGYWRYKQERMEKLIAEGLVAIPPKGKTPRFKRYLDESKGIPLQSVWDDLPPVNSQAKEAIGYPTQKPIGLLERIIRTSSDPDDIVLDAFCGCGTALVASQRLDRRWVGIDISPTACRVMSNRLKKHCALIEGRDFFVRDLPKTAEQLRNYPYREFENWAVNALNTVVVNGKAIANKVKVGDMGIDGRIYPIRADKTRETGWDLFGPTDDWLPVQVKQVDVVNRDEIDTYFGAMKRQKRQKGFFISFGFSSGALKEMKRLHDDPHDGLEIIPLTVDEILAEEVRYRV